MSSTTTLTLVHSRTAVAASTGQGPVAARARIQCCGSSNPHSFTSNLTPTPRQYSYRRSCTKRVCWRIDAAMMFCATHFDLWLESNFVDEHQIERWYDEDIKKALQHQK